MEQFSKLQKMTMTSHIAFNKIAVTRCSLPYSVTKFVKVANSLKDPDITGRATVKPLSVFIPWLVIILSDECVPSWRLLPRPLQTYLAFFDKGPKETRPKLRSSVNKSLDDIWWHRTWSGKHSPVNQNTTGPANSVNNKLSKAHSQESNK